MVCLKGNLCELEMMLGLGKFWLVHHQHQRSLNCDLQENIQGLGQTKGVQVYFQPGYSLFTGRLLLIRGSLFQNFEVWLDIGWVYFGLGSSFMNFSGIPPLV